MEQEKSFLGAFFSFNLAVISGIIIGLVVNARSSEVQPVSSFLFAPTLYIISSVLAASTRLVLWLTMEKGTMFEFKHVLLYMIRDVIVINVVILSTLSFIFLWETYIQ